MKLTKITECRECGSTNLTWQTHNQNISEAPHGRLRTSDVRCQMVLGCDHCSETLAVYSADQVAAWLTDQQGAEQDVQGGDPIMLTAVADLVDDDDGGLEARWILEGGTAELVAGMTLLVADNAPDLCHADGSAEVYQRPQKPAALELPDYSEKRGGHFYQGWNELLERIAAQVGIQLKPKQRANRKKAE